jgi:hypothetical protein
MNLRRRDPAAWLALSAAAVWLLARLLRMVLHPLPHYEAESAMAWSTHLLTQGQSPWSLANYPASLNAYGIGYHLLCAPFARIFGSTLPLHRGVSVACLLLAASLIYFAARRLGQPRVLSAWAALVCLAAWSINITPTARPDALVLLLYLGALALVEAGESAEGALVLSALLSAAAFYVKPYGILAAPIAWLSLAWRGRWRATVSHGLITGAVWLLLSVWVRAFHPLYFEQVFLVNLNIAGADFLHRAAQWKQLLPECAALALLVLGGLFSGRPGVPALLERLGRPWLMPLFVSALAFHFKLSLHTGATLTYFYQLVLPCLVLAALAQWQGRPLWALGFAFGCLSIGLGWSLAQAPYAPLQADRAGAAQLEAYLAPSQHPAGNGHAAAFLWPRGSVVFDYGQAEFARFAERDHGWPRLFPHAAELTQRRLRFEAAMVRAIQSQRFGVLAMGRQGSPLEAALDPAYALFLQAALHSPQVPYQVFQLGLYRPRGRVRH